MAYFVAAVVPDSVAVVVCRQVQAVMCWYVTDKIILCCFVLDVLLIGADS